MRQGAAQVVFHEQLVAGLGVQRFGEDLDLMLAIGLGLVQGQPGIAHQGLWVAAVHRRAGHAHGAGNADQLVVDEHRFIQCHQQLAGDLLADIQVGVVQ
ncbi:hypothetical protein D3C84_1086560 [compost metagenome]